MTESSYLEVHKISGYTYFQAVGVYMKTSVLFAGFPVQLGEQSVVNTGHVTSSIMWPSVAAIHAPIKPKVNSETTVMDCYAVFPTKLLGF